MFRFVAVAGVVMLGLSGCQSSGEASVDQVEAQASAAAVGKNRAQSIWDTLTGPEQSYICLRWNEPASDDWQYMDKETVAETALEYAIEAGKTTSADNTVVIQDGLYKVLMAECG